MFEYSVKADFGRGDIREWTRTIAADNASDVQLEVLLDARDYEFKVINFHIVRVK